MPIGRPLVSPKFARCMCAGRSAPAHGMPPSTAAPTGFGGCRWGDRAGRVIAGKRDPMKQVGSARAVATSKARIQAARHEASARIAGYKKPIGASAWLASSACRGGSAQKAVLPNLALHHGRTLQGHHILTDGPFRFQVPDDIDERPTLFGRR